MDESMNIKWLITVENAFSALGCIAPRPATGQQLTL